MLPINLPKDGFFSSFFPGFGRLSYKPHWDGSYDRLLSGGNQVKRDQIFAEKNVTSYPVLQDPRLPVNPLLYFAIRHTIRTNHPFPGFGRVRCKFAYVQLEAILSHVNHHGKNLAHIRARTKALTQFKYSYTLIAAFMISSRTLPIWLKLRHPHERRFTSDIRIGWTLHHFDYNRHLPTPNGDHYAAGGGATPKHHTVIYDISSH